MMPALPSGDAVLIDTPLQHSAQELQSTVGDEAVEQLVIRTGSREIVVPADVADFMTFVLRHTAEGGAFTISAEPEELSTTVAAKLLGISRPTLMKLIDKGEIPARKVGSHSRLLSRDVHALKARRATVRRRAFEELQAISEDLYDK